jgi:hypothetical protein
MARVQDRPHAIAIPAPAQTRLCIRVPISFRILANARLQATGLNSRLQRNDGGTRPAAETLSEVEIKA